MGRRRRARGLVEAAALLVVLGAMTLPVRGGAIDTSTSTSTSAHPSPAGSSTPSASPAPSITTPSPSAASRGPEGQPASYRLPVSTGPTHWHGHRVLYLTFDDGPSPYTPQILAVLRRYGDTATFFEIGRNAAAYPQYVADVVAEGSAIGNHTYTHPDLDLLTAPRVHEELARADAAIRAGGAPTTRCVRPPYGANTLAVREEIRRLGKSTVVWDIDTLDWKKPGVQAIARSVIHHARPGDIAIMHDGGGNRSQTVAALALIALHFHHQGWVLRSLPICSTP